ATRDGMGDEAGEELVVLCGIIQNGTGLRLIRRARHCACLERRGFLQLEGKLLLHLTERCEILIKPCAIRCAYLRHHDPTMLGNPGEHALPCHDERIGAELGSIGIFEVRPEDPGIERCWRDFRRVWRSSTAAAYCLPRS